MPSYYSYIILRAAPNKTENAIYNADFRLRLPTMGTNLKDDDPLAPSLIEAAERIRRREISPVELTRASLERVTALAGLNAFITVTADLALEQARAAEQEIAAGKYRGPLHGIPIALKDLIDVAGVRTTAASRVFADRVAERDAETVTRLKAAGAVILGKTNLHEFAYGGSGVIGAYGITRNPCDPARITGGSSSGSAAAVAAQMCFAAIGTDTAGSIRLPAAYCGIVGFKPTFALVSAVGVVPLAESYDHVGPMTRTIADAEALLRVLAGLPPDAARVDWHQVRVAAAREYFCSDLDPEVAAVFDAAVRALEAICPVRGVALPVDEDRTVHLYEAFHVHESHVARSADLYDPETLRRIRSGEGISEADYFHKQGELEAVRKMARYIFRDFDILLTPTAPIPPPTIADLTSNPDRLRSRELLMLRNTRPFNVLGAPAISLPCGRTRSGLPIGIQLAAAPGRDLFLLSFAKELEARLLAPAS